MTFKDSKQGAIPCYKTFTRVSSNLAATIQKRYLQTVATALKTLPDSAVLEKENSRGGGLLGRKKSQIGKYHLAFPAGPQRVCSYIVCSAAPPSQKGQAELEKDTVKDIRDGQRYGTSSVRGKLK